MSAIRATPSNTPLHQRMAANNDDLFNPSKIYTNIISDNGNRTIVRVKFFHTLKDFKITKTKPKDLRGSNGEGIDKKRVVLECDWTDNSGIEQILEIDVILHKKFTKGQSNKHRYHLPTPFKIVIQGPPLFKGGEKSEELVIINEECDIIIPPVR